MRQYLALLTGSIHKICLLDLPILLFSSTFYFGNALEKLVPFFPDFSSNGMDPALTIQQT
jgi:hypothetical protein